MFPYTIKIFQSATQYLTWNESSGMASRIVAREMTHNANHPRTFSMRISNLDAGALNYLSSTFAGWTAGYTGAIAVGQEIEYDTIEMDLTTGSYSTASLTFYGVITEISQGDDGLLVIKAKDFSERLEHIYASKTAFTNYRDRLPSDWGMVGSAETPGSKLAVKLPDSNLAYPAVSVLFATGDRMWQISDSLNNYSVSVAEDEMMCQAFIAAESGLYHTRFRYQTSGNWTEVNGHVQIRIVRDTGSDRPDFSAEMATRAIFLAPHTGLIDAECSIVDSDDIVYLEKGEKYWWTIENHDSGDTDPANIVIGYDPYSTYKCDGSAAGCYHRSSGGTYTPWGGNLQVTLWACEFNECSPDTYHYEYIAPYHWIVLDKSPGQWEGNIVPAGREMSLHRGLLSYYYGAKTTQEILNEIIPLDYGYFKLAGNRVISSLLSVTRHLFRTKGKSLGASMRELCDSMAVYTGGNYFQSAYAVYDHPGETYEHIIRCGMKKPTWYGSADYTIADGTWIVSVDAAKTSTNRPSRVVVIGKTTAAGTITATVEDDDWLALCKIPITETIQDDTIQTVGDAFAQANARLQSYQRGVWEGRMRLYGVFPQLMQEHDPTAGVGDGAVISVTYAPLAWSSIKLKVTGITIGEDYTDVQFSSADLLLSNKFVQNVYRLQLTDSFVSPTDAETILYFPIYTTKTTSSSPLYAQFCTAAGTPITDHKRVKGSSYDQTNPVRRTWHFEFDARNGHTADGTPIDRIEIYTAATGGSALTDIVFATDLSAAYLFHKWKTTKVIVDLVINPS
jgi:hypothetical protein